MAKATNEELQAELEKAVDEHNKAVQTQGECKTKIIALRAVLSDRAPEQEEAITPEAV
jgi:hypothetical protein|tara:strand:+ start:335 stop:508 length:174 start_codon:yes stop_codon:yes gene_type:complete